MFMPHSNLYRKIATLYLMFAALGSVHDNEQSKVTKITVHCTGAVFSLMLCQHVMPGTVFLPFFHAFFPS